jgi:hypothetical protein
LVYQHGLEKGTPQGDRVEISTHHRNGPHGGPAGAKQYPPRPP